MWNSSKNTIAYSLGMHRNVPLNIKLLLLSLRDSIILEDSEGKKNKNVKVSKLDLPDLNWLSDEDILNAIQIDLWINLLLSEDSEEYQKWIKKINELINKSISSFYSWSRRDRILKKRWITVNNIWLKLPIKNHHEILVFLKSISEDRKNKELLKADLKCYLTKVVSVVNNLLENWLDKLNKIEPELFNKISSILNINNQSWDYYTWTINSRSFLFYWRSKTIKSCIWKWLNDVDYSNLNKLKDWIGYTFELQWAKKDILNDAKFILNIVYKAIIALWWNNLKIKIKWFKNLDLSDFEWIKIEETKKMATSDTYEDVKICWDISWMIWWIEIKITKRWNKNDNWINFPYVYKIFTYIESTIWRHFNGWIIEENEIDDAVELFFNEIEKQLSENLKTKAKTKIEYEAELWNDLKKGDFIEDKKMNSHLKWFEKQLKLWLKNYYISKLIKIWEWLYTTKRANAINQAWKSPKKK